MGRFVLAERVRADLIGIWRYSAQRWGDDQAERYIRGIWHTFERIAENPRRGRSCGAGHFKMLVGAHAVIFRVLDDGIGIVRVLHQAMDIPRHLKPPPRP